ncbi:MAG: glycosyltransferase family 2 protein [Candidatus Omnitrophica bacterium]|nr:glycosyltransferase family 2 protein [Candidatus Omnitrophota bacterium]
MISIIICTYNRCAILKKALASLRDLQPVTGQDHEIIVVDNNSQDDTRQATEALIPQFGGKLRYVFEPRLGVSAARNKGIKESVGDIVAFIDDDCVVTEDWLMQLYDTLQRRNADMVGGKILPLFPDDAPAWARQEGIKDKFSLLDRGDEEFRVLSLKDELYGGNLAVRKSGLLEIGGFDVHFGSVGASMLFGDEKEVVCRFLMLGKTVYYQPKAVVYHQVRKDKLSKAFCLRKAFADGRIFVRMKRKHGRAAFVSLTPRFTSFFHAFGYSLRWLAGIVRAAALRRKDELLQKQLQIAYLCGIGYESLRRKSN